MQKKQSFQAIFLSIFFVTFICSFPKLGTFALLQLHEPENQLIRVILPEKLMVTEGGLLDFVFLSLPKILD